MLQLSALWHFLATPQTPFCSTISTRGNYTICGLVHLPRRWNATIFYCDLTSPCFNLFGSCDFPTFRLSTMDLYWSPSNHPILYRPLLAASNVLPKRLRPLVASVLHSHCRIPCCHQILASGEKGLAPKTNHGALHPEILLLLATLVAYGNHGLCRFLLADEARWQYMAICKPWQCAIQWICA